MTEKNPLSSHNTIQQTIQSLAPEAERFLCEFMKYPSTPGKEHEAMLFLEKEFGKLAGATVGRVDLANSLRDDPDYSDPIPDIEYDGRFNLRAERKGKGGGPKILLNAHTDVVPPNQGMVDPWSPRVENGVVYGRGACDDKGPLTAIYLVLRALAEMDAELAADVVAHLVVEEENGGNGSMAMARTGEKADACIVLEPTTEKVYTSIRGAVWFRFEFHGAEGHSGQAGRTRSALLLARDAINALEKYHAELLKNSRGFPLFDIYPNPMPLTFGHLEAGNWPSAAPHQALLEGVLGFLPNMTKERIREEIVAALAEGGLTESDYDLSFTYAHDCSVIPPDHDLASGLVSAAEAAGAPVEIAAFPASCDAWFYNNQLGIPTVVYGPGTLGVAHSRDEQIAIKDILTSAEILLTYLTNVSGD